MSRRSVEFVIWGDPKPKGRPRFINTGKFVSTYTPRETRNYEAAIRQAYKDTNGNLRVFGALRAEIIAVFGIPKSASKKNRELMATGQIFCKNKKDCDNLAKTVLDALNKTAYHDDNQVVELFTRKEYGETPCIKVKLYELEDIPDDERIDPGYIPLDELPFTKGDDDSFEE